MNTIIEVSSSNADIASPTSLTTVMSPPLVLAQPSTLSFNEGFIDLREIGNSGSDSFILNEDTEIVITMAFYEVFNAQLTKAATDLNPSNARFSAFNGTEITGNDLLNYVGRVYAMYQVVYDNNSPNVILNFGDGGSAPAVFPIKTLKLIEESFVATIPAGTYTSTTIVQKLNDIFQGTYYPPLEFYGIDNLPIGTEKNVFYLPFKYFYEKYTRWDGANFQSAVVFLRAEDNPIKTDFTIDQYAYYYPQKGTFPDVMIGCPIVSLQNADDIISFAYLHNPLYKQDASGDRDEFIQLNYLTNPDTSLTWYWRYARGGVAITELRPPSFWDDLLGFNTSSFNLQVNFGVAVDRDKIIDGMDTFNISGANSLRSATTRPYIGVSDVDNYINAGISNDILFDTVFTNEKPTTASKELQTLAINNTVPISAIRPIQYAQFNSGGHYRIEIDIGYYINNFNSAKTKKSIACLASREYLTNGFLSIFSGGQPIALPAGSVLSYITINILDPITGQPATNIGTNNTFYFSLTS